MKIGITGKSGSGKTTYSKIYAEKTGYAVINIDEISHHALELPHIKAKLIECFGENIISENSINRKLLGDLVFTNRHLYEQMSDVIWNEVKNIIDFLLRENENVIIDWILLPHTHYWKICDKKILVTVSDEIRKQRVLQRDNITEEYFIKREQASIDYDDFAFDEIILGIGLNKE